MSRSCMDAQQPPPTAARPQTMWRSLALFIKSTPAARDLVLLSAWGLRITPDSRLVTCTTFGPVELPNPNPQIKQIQVAGLLFLIVVLEDLPARDQDISD